MLYKTALVALAAALATVSAQDTSGISVCILACSAASAKANNCTSFADFQCVCSSAQFQADAAKCIQDHCPTELEAAVSLQRTQCGALSITPTGTAGPAKTLTDVTIASTTGTTSTSGTTTAPASGTTTKPATTSGTTTSPAASTSTAAGNNGASAAGVAWGAVAVGVAVFAL
ncbi:hypothetical protein DFP72DRAFT_904880 [Ephemerocybe angulata]|uniref:CFEM domain-containing protein n=1 Tax=Ephemerocybe angulata TaxID=980116 RepID=A0A8H6HTD3_9AGAR|nr:hypothetical protein DFP72DRAFT_904880 [Tulosesus angulatus]